APAAALHWLRHTRLAGSIPAPALLQYQDLTGEQAVLLRRHVRCCRTTTVKLLLDVLPQDASTAAADGARRVHQRAPSSLATKPVAQEPHKPGRCRCSRTLR